MKSEIDRILGLLDGTREYDILTATEEKYMNLKELQSDWYSKAGFLCPDGCGSCCNNFEPDLLECEALYMAAWLLENQNEKALQIAEGTYSFNSGKTCPMFQADSKYHCTIYGGRPFICRLFGASCANAKNGEPVWRPCHFYPDEILKEYDSRLEKRQFSKKEAEEILGALPPVMSTIMEQALSLSPDDNQTELIRNILPGTIRKLLWLCTLNGNDNDTPRGSPNNTAA